MKSNIKYRYTCEKAFFDFLKDEDLGKLSNTLYDVEFEIMDETGFDMSKCLWFKFGSDDTLATDIKDIQNIIRSGNQKNRAFLLEQMRSITEVSEELEVYFS